MVLSVKQNRVAYAIRSLINEKKFEVGGKEWSLLEGRALNRIIMVHQNRFTQVNSGGLTSTLIDLSLSLSISLPLSLSLTLHLPYH